MTTSKRTGYHRAVAGYDADFERRLVDVITATICDASVASDTNLLIIRTGETASALLTVLASIVALSPASTRSPTAIRKTIDDLGKRLRQEIAAAERDPLFRGLVAGAFRSGDWGDA